MVDFQTVLSLQYCYLFLLLLCSSPLRCQPRVLLNSCVCTGFSLIVMSHRVKGVLVRVPVVLMYFHDTMKHFKYKYNGILSLADVQLLLMSY